MKPSDLCGPSRKKLLWLEEFAGLDEAQDKLSAWMTFITSATCTRLWAIKAPRSMSSFIRRGMGKAA